MFSSAWAFRREAVHFLEWIRGNAEPLSPMADVVNDIYLGEQMIRSAQENRPIELQCPRSDAVA